MATDPLAHVRTQVASRIAEIRDAGPRISPLALYARMDSIRQLAAEHGLAALESLAHRTAELALLPGHRISMQSCLEHVDEAFDCHSDHDCTAMLAALAVRIR
ncbi:MAG TPA: hypothetical protein VE989_11810 [Sphingomicrobium sp.]|jgi:hypothetical protein|nr:hypothetical protein [Sphingomicrobium sp.]